MKSLGARRRTGEEFQTSNLELFFDLVFVFAITQVSHLLLEHLTWPGALQSLIVLLVVWWAWQYTTWATNELDPDVLPVRLLLIVIMLASLLMSIAIPEAFGDRGLLFACAYVFIQVGRHSFLTFAAAGPGTVERQRAMHILVWFLTAAVFWLAGGLVDGNSRIIVWLFALLIDYGGPTLTYRVPFMKNISTQAWNVGGSHFAERFQLFTIIALGETIVLNGATTAGLQLDFAIVAAFGLAFVSTVALWWLYFNYVATVFERFVVEAEDSTAVARGLYTYGHVPIIAGIILCAVGDEIVIAHPTDVLESAQLLVVLAGPVLYLGAYIPIRLLLTGTLPARRLVGMLCAILIGLIAWVTGLAAALVLGLLVAVLISVIVRESLNREKPHPREAPSQ